MSVAPYAPLVDVQILLSGAQRIKVGCSHCKGRHWVPVVRDVSCLVTGRPLRVAYSALVEARRRLAYESR
ncbi:hypothetical protein [Nocardia aurea]|uniref:hypothetical protein n=1 Tax=Nocardia aurea TaxID=2144174 RepID=UPI0033B39879